MQLSNCPIQHSLPLSHQRFRHDRNCSDLALSSVKLYDAPPPTEPSSRKVEPTSLTMGPMTSRHRDPNGLPTTSLFPFSVTIGNELRRKVFLSLFYTLPSNSATMPTELVLTVVPHSTFSSMARQMFSGFPRGSLGFQDGASKCRITSYGEDEREAAKRVILSPVCLKTPPMI